MCLSPISNMIFFYRLPLRFWILIVRVERPWQVLLYLFCGFTTNKKSQDKYHAVINGNTSCISKNFPEASYQIRMLRNKSVLCIHSCKSSLIEFFMLLGKVKTFWESHKIWKKITHLFWRYWVDLGVFFKFCGFIRNLNFI